MADRLQGGRLAARAIRAHGVGTIFTLSGGHVMPIYEGCRHEDVRVVDVRHEAAAGHAAEAYGRMRRSCGVAVVTAGPGVTNVVTAVANCFAAQTPLVVIGGARPLAQAELGALQEFDQLSLLKPITKWAAVCASPDRIEEYVAIAFRHALAHPRGPVYLELPMDVLFADGDVSDARAPGEAARAVPEPAAIERAAALLEAAERPVLLGGAAIWWDGAWDELRALAEQARLPVFLNGSGRGALPPDHELFFQHARRTALEAADVVCVAGASLDFRLGYGRFGDAKLIHVHADERELGRNRIPDVPLAGDTAAALAAIAANVSPRDRPEWFDVLRAAEQEWWDAHRSQIESGSAPVHHYRLGAELDRAIGDDVVVIGDGGDVVAAVSRVLRVRRPGHWLDPGPFGCLGVGLPYALGVAAARPDARILVVSGDGALGLNGFELDTLARFGIPAVVVVGNDGAWGEIRIPQIGIYGEEGELATRLEPSSYELLTEVFAGHAELVERPDEIGPAVERAFASGEPAVVNVLLDPDAMQGHGYRGM